MMGMYTTTDYCELQMRKNNTENRKATQELLPKDELHIDKYSGRVEIDVVWKMHGYWYEETLKLLENLNKYIEGSWYLTYEEGDKIIISFLDNPQLEVEIEIGYIQWATPKTLSEFTKELRTI